MPKTHPASISCETHALAGNLVLPDGASPEAPVPGAIFVGGPGPIPLTRYSETGARQWPVYWSEALGAAGLAALCYDQRGSGLSTGVYHEADWDALYEDARAVTGFLSIQPEVSKVAAVAWAEGSSFALQLALEDRVETVVLLAPPYHTAEERYAKEIAALAARNGLSDRVVQLRVKNWREQVDATARRVEQGQTTSTTDVGGKTVVTNLARLVQTLTYSPASVVAHVDVPVLLLHGEADAAIPPSESAAMAQALESSCERITYPDVAHFLYRHPEAIADAARWIHKVLA